MLVLYTEKHSFGSNFWSMQQGDTLINETVFCHVS